MSLQTLSLENMLLLDTRRPLRGGVSLTYECEELAYDGDAEHLPLDEAVGRDARQRGEQPGAEVRQSGEEPVLSGDVTENIITNMKRRVEEADSLISLHLIALSPLSLCTYFHNSVSLLLFLFLYCKLHIAILLCSMSSLYLCNLFIHL